MRIRIITSLSFVVLLMAMAISGSLVQAQMDQSMPPGSTGVTPQPLGSGAPSTAPGLAMGLVRLTFAPGATLNTHQHPGASILYIESGTLTYTLIEGTSIVTRASADPATPPVTEPLAAGAIELQAGDSLFEDADSIHTLNNAGDEPVVVTIANLLTAGEPVSTFLEDGTPTP